MYRRRLLVILRLSERCFGKVRPNFQTKVREALVMAGLIDFVDSLPAASIRLLAIRLSFVWWSKATINHCSLFFSGADVLIFDEATSALDAENERWIVDVINSLPKNITKIVVSHNARAVSACDTILLLDKGTLIGTGSFHTMMNKYSSLVKE